MKKKQNAFVVECANEQFEDIIEAVENGHPDAATTIDAADGWVDIVSNGQGCKDVTVHHAEEENKRECPRLCEAIEKALSSWAEVKEYYDAEEEEEDNNGLDPAFSSWDDYWGYIFRD